MSRQAAIAAAGEAPARPKSTPRFLFELFWRSDTTTIRVFIAVASLGFALILATHPDTFGRPSFSGMAQAFDQWSWSRAIGASNVWCVLFTLHGAGVLWRVWERRTRDVSRPYAAFAINALGFFVWLVSTWLIERAVGELSPGIALEITAVVAAGVAMLRTGLNDEPRTR